MMHVQILDGLDSAGLDRIVQTLIGCRDDAWARASGLDSARSDSTSEQTIARWFDAVAEDVFELRTIRIAEENRAMMAGVEGLLHESDPDEDATR